MTDRMTEYQSLGTARTLGELRKLLDQAIERVGADATWNGWDDGSINIHPNSGPWLKIESGEYS